MLPGLPSDIPCTAALLQSPCKPPGTHVPHNTAGGVSNNFCIFQRNLSLGHSLSFNTGAAAGAFPSQGDRHTRGAVDVSQQHPQGSHPAFHPVPSNGSLPDARNSSLILTALKQQCRKTTEHIHGASPTAAPSPIPHRNPMDGSWTSGIESHRHQGADVGAGAAWLHTTDGHSTSQTHRDRKKLLKSSFEDVSTAAQALSPDCSTFSTTRGALHPVFAAEPQCRGQ